MYSDHKLLVANRGEIAVRILRTARELGLPTLAIYTPSDALSPHVSLADDAVPLPVTSDSELSHSAAESESKAYLSISAIVTVCKENSVTLVHPGYGFLSENSEFASSIRGAGIIWLGPHPDIIKNMGLKHEARSIAISAGLDVVPGSDNLAMNDDVALDTARKIGFPVMIKATAGGGGMGLVVCDNEKQLRERFVPTKDRAKVPHVTVSLVLKFESYRVLAGSFWTRRIVPRTLLPSRTSYRGAG